MDPLRAKVDKATLILSMVTHEKHLGCSSARMTLSRGFSHQEVGVVP